MFFILFALNMLVVFTKPLSSSTVAAHTNRKVHHSTLVQSSPQSSPLSTYSLDSVNPTGENATFVDECATGTDFAIVSKCDPYSHGVGDLHIHCAW